MDPILERYAGNPILEPIGNHPWESSRVFNCAVVYEDGKVHIVYRAQGGDDVSRLGYAESSDGYHVDFRYNQPVFSPLHHFETYGCEDPRITKIDDKFYMCYTAFGRVQRWHEVNSKMRLAQVGIASIPVSNFIDHKWNWSKRIFPIPQVDSKNSVLFPKKFQGKYALYHRISPHIWVTYSNRLADWSNSYHKIVLTPQEKWEFKKIGSGAPPIETEKGWLLIYHGVDESFTYRLGLALIDRDNPEKLSKLRRPIFEPREDYERSIAFCCGAVVMDGTLFVYYGADDRRIGVATADLSELLSLFDGKMCRQVPMLAHAR
ncbi:MAG TPA: hypothetical protein VLV31_03600 [Candidatus Acidoferrales bacterium]|nr:hypothetical protein [Candidatus Acidoferrales bacterium]